MAFANGRRIAVMNRTEGVSIVARLLYISLAALLCVQLAQLPELCRATSFNIDDNNDGEAAEKEDTTYRDEESNEVIAYSGVVGYSGDDEGDDLWLNTTVSWDGGISTDCTCSNSTGCTCSNNTFYSTNYACNAERFPFFGNRPGNWNNGSQTFYLPIPYTHSLIQMNITMYGRFMCNGLFDPSTTNIFFLHVAQETMNVFQVDACSSCGYCLLCDSCETPEVYVSHVYDNFPGWKFMDNNTISIHVVQGIVCLSDILINVHARIPSTPILTGTGGNNNDSEFALPLWGIILLSVGGFICIVIVLIVFILAGINHWDRKTGRSRVRSVPLLGPLMTSLFGDDSQMFIKQPLLGNMQINSDGKGAQNIVRMRVSGHMGKQMAYEEMIVGKRIGKGSYGEVYLGVWRGTEVAIKKLPYYFTELEDNQQQKAFVESFIQETELMQQLRHPNVISLYAAFVEPELCMVMEFMTRGSLYSILHSKKAEQELSLDLLKMILIDSAKGMTYLHNSHPIIIHRDLKSHNLLVGEHWQTKVSDFGLSRMLDMSVMNTMTSCGTPSWTAPEVLRGEKYTEKCDVYSFAIVIWECVTRETPHESMPHFQIVFQVGTQGLRPPIPASCPPAWARLIVDCWAESPDDRPDFIDILERLEAL